MEKSFRLRLILAFALLTGALTAAVIIGWEWYVMKPFYAWVDARYPDPAQSWKIKQRIEHSVISISVDLVVVTLLLRLVGSEHKKLKESEEKYRALFERANDGIAIMGLEDGKIAEANRELIEVTGYSLEELRATPFPELFQAESWLRIRRDLQSSRTLETDLIRREGTRVPIAASFSIVETAQHRFVIGIIRDVSAAKNLERERQQVQSKLYQTSKLASLGELSAGVAHEINNPLNSVINFAQLLLDDTSPDRPEARMLQGIVEEGNRMAKIVRNLLTFARQETTDRSPVDLRRIIEQAFALFEHQLKKDGISVTLELDPELPLITADGSQLKQVLVNLISNARYALLENGGRPNERMIKVRATLSRDAGGERVKVRFFDNGSGIPHEHIDKVFDPFFTTKRDHGGTGLGLSVSFGIVREHGGTIQVASQLGRFCCFTIELPVGARAAASAAHA